MKPLVSSLMLVRNSIQTLDAADRDIRPATGSTLRSGFNFVADASRLWKIGRFAIIADPLDEFVNRDSKFFATICPLLLARPWKLSNQWLTKRLLPQACFLQRTQD